MFKPNSYDSLNPFPFPTNFLELMREISKPIIDDHSETQKLKSVIDLRRLRKHHYDYFNLVYDNIHRVFIKMIQNTSISEELLCESLQLIKEIFSIEMPYSSDDIPDWVKSYVSKLLKFTLRESTSTMAHEILNNIANHMLYSETVEAFMDEIIDSHNDEIMDYAASYLWKNIESFDITNMENSIYWDTCLIKLVEIFENIGGKWKDFVIRVFSHILLKLGRENFEEILNEYSKDDEVNEKIKIIMEKSLQSIANVV